MLRVSLSKRCRYACCLAAAGLQGQVLVWLAAGFEALVLVGEVAATWSQAYWLSIGQHTSRDTLHYS